MTTYAELITRSLRSLGIIEASEVAKGKELITGLETLNEMLHALITDGVDLEHTDGAQQDTMAFPDDHIGPFRYLLAVRLSTEYGVQPTQVVFGLANDGLKQLQRRYIVPDTLEMPETLQAIFNPNNLYLSRL